jgi:hypothetical protein
MFPSMGTNAIGNDDYGGDCDGDDNNIISGNNNNNDDDDDDGDELDQNVA